MTRPGGHEGRKGKKMSKGLNLTNKEIEVLQKCIGLAVKNGNTVRPEAFVPTPDEYKSICSIFNQIVNPT